MKQKVKAKGAAGTEREIAIVGELSLPNAPPAWELQLILSPLARLLTPAAGTLDLERSEDACPG